MHPFQLFLDKLKSKTSDRFDINMENTTNHHNTNVKHNLNSNYDESVPFQMTKMISNHLENNVCSAPVTVNVYDMIWLNEYINLLGIGVYHTGVVIYGTEYCYGGHPLDYSGIFAMLPRDSESLGENYSFRTTLLMGHTDFNPTDISLIIENMGPEYRGDQYHLLHKNCNHFTNEFVKILCGRSLPKWINRLATVGAKLPFVEKSLPKEWLTPRPIETQTISINEDDVLDEFDTYLKLERKNHHHHNQQQQFAQQKKQSKEQEHLQHHSQSSQTDLPQNVFELSNNSRISMKYMKKSLLRRWNSERFFNNSKKLLFKSSIFQKLSNPSTSLSSSSSSASPSLLVLDKSLSHLSFIGNSDLKSNQFHNYHSNSIQLENNSDQLFFAYNNNHHHKIDNQQLITSQVIKISNPNPDHTCLHPIDHKQLHNLTYDHRLSLLSAHLDSNLIPTTTLPTIHDVNLINLSKNISQSEQQLLSLLSTTTTTTTTSSTSPSASSSSSSIMEEKLNLSNKNYLKSNKMYNSFLVRLKSDLHKKYIKFYIYNKSLNNKTKLNNKSIRDLNATHIHNNNYHTTINNTNTTTTTTTTHISSDNQIDDIDNHNVLISSCNDNEKKMNNNLNYSSISINSSSFDKYSSTDPDLNRIYSNCNSTISVLNQNEIDDNLIQNNNLNILSTKKFNSTRNLSSPTTSTSSCFSTSTSRRLFHRIQNLCASGIKDSNHSQLNSNQCLFAKTKLY